jgi:hypothetical protein
VDTRPLERLEGLGVEVMAAIRTGSWSGRSAPDPARGGPLADGYGQSTASAMSVVRAWSSRLTGASR